MNSGLLVIVLGAVAILAVLVVWFWNYTVRQVHRLTSAEKEIRKIWEDRRDLIPFLIETYRAITGESPEVIQEIIDKRAEARNARNFTTLWTKENELEDLLFKLFKSARENKALQGDIAWLEGRTEVEKMSDPIEQKEKLYEQLRQFLRTKSNQPPYFVFGGYIRKHL